MQEAGGYVDCQEENAACVCVRVTTHDHTGCLDCDFHVAVS